MGFNWRRKGSKEEGQRKGEGREEGGIIVLLIYIPALEDHPECGKLPNKQFREIYMIILCVSSSPIHRDSNTSNRSDEYCPCSYVTSAKIIQYGCRDAPCKKSWKQGNPLSNTIKDTSTIMRNPLPELCREGLRMIVLVSLIVLLR